MKEILNALEKYNEVSLELDCKGQEFKEEIKKRGAKKLQTLYLELKPYIDLYKNISEKERQTIKIIIKEDETYNKSPYVYLSGMTQNPVLYASKNGHFKTLHEHITLSEDDYKYFCIYDSLIQDMDTQKIKESFKKEILNAIKRATKNKENQMVKIIDSLSAFYSEDKNTTLQKQLEELFKLKDEYKATNNEFCLSLVLNQIEKIEKMIEGGEN